MSLFAELLSKQLPNIDFPSIDAASIAKLQFSLNYNSIQHLGISLLYYIYYLPFASKPIQKTRKVFANKFEILDTIILENHVITEYEKNYFFNKFTSAQKTYNSFRRLAHICKHRYCKKFEITTDLCFTEFSNFKANMLISILENNITYTFRIADLINIINKSLTHSSHFFADPQKIKNPYTNLPFATHNLYNIYFKLKDTNYITPILFEMFFITGFNINKFKNHNECYIRDRTIDNFIVSASIDEQYEYIMKMFYIHNSSIYFKIDPYFPRSKLTKIFKKYLHSFLLQEYSLNPHVREVNRIHLQYNLTIFSQLNPDFGKRIWIRKRRASQSSSQISSTFAFHDTIIDADDLIQSRVVGVGSYLAVPPRFPRLASTFLSEATHNEELEQDSENDAIPADDMEDDEEENEEDDAADEAEAEEYEEEQAEPQPVVLSDGARSYLAHRRLVPDYSENAEDIESSSNYPITNAILNSALLDISNGSTLTARPSIFRDHHL